MTVEKLWDRSNRVPILIACGATIAIIALIDWWTLPYVSLGLLYLFPIMLAAGFLPRSGLLMLGVLCAGLSEMFSALDPAWRISRVILETLAFAGCGLFVSELLRNRRLSLPSNRGLAASLRGSSKQRDRLPPGHDGQRGKKRPSSIVLKSGRKESQPDDPLCS